MEALEAKSGVQVRTEYLYDANNRVTKMTPKDSGGTVVACDVVEYFYDLTQNSYGRLSAIQWGSKDLNPQNQPLCAKGLHREEYAYTAGGRPTNKTLKLTRKFADLSFAERTAQMSIDYEYQPLNAKLLQKLYYPATHTQTGPNQPVNLLAGSVYQYTYDSMGRATGETRQDPNQSAVSLVDQVTYNTFGALTQMRQTLVNKTETRAYDSFQRLTSMTTLDGTAITYNYSQTANDGKIVSQVTTPSGSPTETVNYTYDALGRLTQAATAGAGGWGMAWIYDGWGNRLNQTAVKGAVPTMVTITDPATNRIQAHTYDANGNTINTPQQGAMTYDVQNRLKTVASDTYGYDPSNKRIWKNDEYTFWGAAGERIGRYSAVKLIDTSGGTPVHSFVFQKIQIDEYFGGRRLTTQDRLGSVGSYYPYGESKSGTVSNADSFATYYRDYTGLDYADQRYCVASYARFLTSDPYQASASGIDPRSWNRYSYARADPTNANDPTGLADCPVSTGTSVTVCATGDRILHNPSSSNFFSASNSPSMMWFDEDPMALAQSGAYGSLGSASVQLSNVLRGAAYARVGGAIHDLKNRSGLNEECSKALEKMGVSADQVIQMTKKLFALDAALTQASVSSVTGVPGTNTSVASYFQNDAKVKALAGLATNAIYIDIQSANYLSSAQAFGLVLHETLHFLGLRHGTMAEVLQPDSAKAGVNFDTFSDSLSTSLANNCFKK